MLRNVLSIALLLAAAGSAGAWAPPVTPTTVSAIKSGSAKARFEEADIADLKVPPGGVEVFVDGALFFSHADRYYALKTVFARAAFDPALGTYRTALRYQLSDFTEEDVSFWVPIDPGATPVANYHNNFDGTQLRIASGPRQVEITAVTNGKSKKFKFYVKDLLAAWEENARKYSRQLGGNTWHFVPQVVWHPVGDANYYSRIFVVSGEQPLDDATGFPLDAIRTCSSLDNWLGCSIGNFAVSMATGLRVEQDFPNDGDKLKVEEMDVYNMKYVAMDELNGDCWHYNCAGAQNEFNNW
jgi:hypothetical protein